MGISGSDNIDEFQQNSPCMTFIVLLSLDCEQDTDSTLIPTETRIAHGESSSALGALYDCLLCAIESKTWKRGSGVVLGRPLV